MSPSESTTQNNEHIEITEEPFSKFFEYSDTFFTAVIFSLFLIVCILIVVICKYRNRDEGTYIIDESKNYGPFGELETPLNGSSKKQKKKSILNDRRKDVSNKEWYV